MWELHIDDVMAELRADAELDAWLRHGEDTLTDEQRAEIDRLLPVEHGGEA